MASGRHPTTTPRKVLVYVTDGSEEIETVTVIDTLRRAEFDVVSASTTGKKTVTCSRGVKIVRGEDAVEKRRNSRRVREGKGGRGTAKR